MKAKFMRIIRWGRWMTIAGHEASHLQLHV